MGVRFWDKVGRLLSLIRKVNLSGFVSAIICFCPLDLSLRHCLCFEYAAVPYHVVRATGITPIANRRPQRYPPPIALDRPFCWRQGRNHLLTTSAAALVNSRTISLTDVEHTILKVLRYELNVFRPDLFDLLHGAEGSVFRCASGRRSQSNRCDGAVASGLGRKCSISSTTGRRGRR